MATCTQLYTYAVTPRKSRNPHVHSACTHATTKRLLHCIYNLLPNWYIGPCGAVWKTAWQWQRKETIPYIHAATLIQVLYLLSTINLFTTWLRSSACKAVSPIYGHVCASFWFRWYTCNYAQHIPRTYIGCALSKSKKVALEWIAQKVTSQLCVVSVSFHGNAPRDGIPYYYFVGSSAPSRCQSLDTSSMSMDGELYIHPHFVS